MTPEAETRSALVVATGRYSDAKFQELRAPEADAQALAAVLGDPAIGGYEVDVAIDEDQPRLLRRIAKFFANRRPDDLLFLHFSGHGIKDARGDLYLAATDTEFDLLSATGISARWLNEQFSHTRSRRTLVLLDCCLSGAFPFGTRARAGADIDVPDQFRGHGRGLAVITASSAMEYSFEGDQPSGEGQPSYFTTAVVEGLQSGRADRDQDRLISVQDLYAYVHDSVTAKTPNQTPNIKSELEGPLFIARSIYQPPVRPKPLDSHLLALLEHPIRGAREGAVQELEVLLRSRDAGVTLSAREALQRMVKDDSQSVSARAKAALADVTDADEALDVLRQRAAALLRVAACRERDHRRAAERRARPSETPSVKPRVSNQKEVGRERLTAEVLTKRWRRRTLRVISGERRYTLDAHIGHFRTTLLVDGIAPADLVVDEEFAGFPHRAARFAFTFADDGTTRAATLVLWYLTDVIKVSGVWLEVDSQVLCREGRGKQATVRQQIA